MIKEAEIQFDLDGVLVATDDQAVNKMNRVAKTLGIPPKFSSDQIDNYYWLSRTLKSEFGLTDIDSWWDKEVVLEAKPYPFAIPLLKTIDQMWEGRVNFVTSRSAFAAGWTRQWFAKHYPKPLFDDRVYVRDSHNTIGGEGFKLNVLELSGAKRAYEDSGDTALKMGDKSRLVDRPYNRQAQYLGLPRVSGWWGILCSEIDAKRMS